MAPMHKAPNLHLRGMCMCVCVCVCVCDAMPHATSKSSTMSIEHNPQYISINACKEESC